MLAKVEKRIEETQGTDKKINDSKTKQYLTFQLAEEFYGLDLTLAKEIIKLRKITVIPNTKEYALGVINLRGRIVPILDLKRKFNLFGDNISEETKKIIIVNLKNILVGFLVDNIKEVVEESSLELEKLTKNEVIKNDYFKGVLKVDEILINIINIHKVIFDNA